MHTQTILQQKCLLLIVLFTAQEAMTESLLPPLQQKKRQVHRNSLFAKVSSSSSLSGSDNDDGSCSCSGSRSSQSSFSAGIEIRNSARVSRKKHTSPTTSTLYQSLTSHANNGDFEDTNDDGDGDGDGEISNNKAKNTFQKRNGIWKRKSTSSSSLYQQLLHRAGSIVSTKNNNNKHEFLMSCALFTSYFAIMGAKCALPSVFALITSENSGLALPSNIDITPQQIIAQVLTLSTCAIAFGKFLLGPIIDKYGGVSCLKVALSTLMALLALLASTNSYQIFAITLIGVDFIFSSCWAACLNAIHHSFHQDQWSSCIGLLAVAARVGNASSFLFFASLLQWTQRYRTNTGGLIGQSWRNVYWASAFLQIIPIALLTISNSRRPSLPDGNGDANNDEIVSILNSPVSTTVPSKPTIRKSIQILKKEATTVSFWMHLLSRSCLMVIASFLLFVPSYMTNAFGLTSAASARVGSIYALGCLLSVSIGSKYFPLLNTRGKVISSIGCLGAVVLVAIAQLLHIVGTINMTALGGTISMFLWGFAFAVPFYIPPSMYALKRGGKDSSATSKFFFLLFLLFLCIDTHFRSTFLIFSVCHNVSKLLMHLISMGFCCWLHLMVLLQVDSKMY